MVKRVLFCDDSKISRQRIIDSLVEDGWEIVAEAVNGREAIEKYKETNSDAVSIRISPPRVIVSKEKWFNLPGNIQPVCIPFECIWGSLAVQIAMEKETSFQSTTGRVEKKSMRFSSI